MRFHKMVLSAVAVCFLFFAGCSAMGGQYAAIVSDMVTPTANSVNNKETLESAAVEDEAIEGQLDSASGNSVTSEAFAVFKATALNGGASLKCQEITSKEDVKRFSQPTIKNLISALRNLTWGAELTFEAADLKEEAERMAIIREKMNNDPSILEDKEKLKEILNEVNSATEKISQIDYETDLNKEKAHKNMAEMLLRFGIASFYDTKAEAHAGHLMTCTGKSIKNIKDNPMTLIRHPSLLISIKDYAFLANLVVNNIAGQMKQIANISSGLNAYAKRHEIKTPTKEELQEKAKEYEPEINDEDLT